jgi:cell division septum initiation protein DivIVA
MIIVHIGHTGITGRGQATGPRGGAVPGPTTDGGEGRLPEIDADGLMHAEIPAAKRGYDPDAVDELLERAAATIDRLQALDEPAMEHRRRTQADLLHRTLLMAQASADHHLTEAESTAASLVADAQARASRLVAEAEHAAEVLMEARSAQARAAIGGLLERRGRLERDVEALEHYAAAVRSRLREVFTREAVALERLLSDATSDRPQLREIDLTDPMLDRSIEPALTPASADDPVAWVPDDQRRPVPAVLVAEAEARSA